MAAMRVLEPTLPSTHEVLDGHVSLIISGCKLGSCQLDQAKLNNWQPLRRILALMDKIGLEQVLIPPPAFGHRIATKDDKAWNLGLVSRTFEAADGAMGDMNLGLGICNADCNVGILCDPDSERWWLLHLATKCLLPQEGSPYKSIIHAAVAASGKPASALLLWVGGGIGPCCYRYADKSRLLQEIGFQYPDLPLELPPPDWCGPHLVAINIWEIVRLISQELGGFSKLEIVENCSSCAADHGRFMYYSNVRDIDGTGDRNCLLFRRLK